MEAHLRQPIAELREVWPGRTIGREQIVRKVAEDPDNISLFFLKRLHRRSVSEMTSRLEVVHRLKTEKVQRML